MKNYLVSLLTAGVLTAGASEINATSIPYYKSRMKSYECKNAIVIKANPTPIYNLPLELKVGIPLMEEVIIGPPKPSYMPIKKKSEPIILLEED
ncbi:Uncharacterised protein [uncultured archaeon]|nr:Uncharacterised protein [uncultured archaeon]